MKKRKIRPIPPIEQCQKLGIITRTHGTDGTLLLKSFLRSIPLTKKTFVFIPIDGIVIPFRVTGINPQKSNYYRITFEGISYETAAQVLQQKMVYIPARKEKTTQKPLNYEGFIIQDKKLGDIGKILRIDNFKGNIVFTLRYKGKEILYPFIEKNLNRIDFTKKIIYINCSPEGIFDL